MLKNPSHSALGSELRRERKSARVTQAELAQKIGSSVPAIRRSEAGRGSLAVWQRSLDALGLEVIGRNISSKRPLGRRLAELRRRQGCSQRELAAMTETSQPSIIALERDRGRTLRVLDRVACVLGAGLYLAPKGSGGRSFYTHAGNSATCQRWETPAELLAVLYSVFRFDLDPCSPTRRGPVRAQVHFTADNDGLRLRWHGVVFLNPPYGRQLRDWIAKARNEVESGNATTVVALIPARTDTTYWHEHIAGRGAVYFLRGRLKFAQNGQGDQSAPFPSALVIWGVVPAEVIERLDETLPAWRAR